MCHAPFRTATVAATLVVLLAAGACSEKKPEGASAPAAPAASASPSVPPDKAGLAPAAPAAAADKVHATYDVDGKTVSITKKQYDALFAHLELYYRVFVLTEDMADRHLWMHLLRLEEAKLAGIVATDRDVREHLTYLLGGEFDDAKYQEILDYAKIPRAEFEETVRGVMMGEKLIDFYRDTARSLDTDVLKRYVDRESRFTLTGVAFPYTDYVEGDSPEPPSIDLFELLERLQQLYARLDDLNAASPPNADAIAKTKDEIARLEAMQKVWEAIQAREDAAMKLAKKAADDVKKQILDATFAANQSIFEAQAAKVPEKIAAAEKDLLAKMGAGATLDAGVKQKLEARISQETKLEAQHATKPLQSKFFDEVVKKRDLKTFEMPSYRVDWETIDLRLKDADRRIGRTPAVEDYERYVRLNTTIPRLVKGQLGGVFQDQLAKANYIYVMRDIQVPEAKSIDPLRYRINRKYFETVRRNQMEAMFSHAPIMTRHKLNVLEPVAPKDAPIQSLPPGKGK